MPDTAYDPDQTPAQRRRRAYMAYAVPVAHHADYPPCPSCGADMSDRLNHRYAAIRDYRQSDNTLVGGCVSCGFAWITNGVEAPKKYDIGEGLFRIADQIKARGASSGASTADNPFDPGFNTALVASAYTTLGNLLALEPDADVIRGVHTMLGMALKPLSAYDAMHYVVDRVTPELAAQRNDLDATIENLYEEVEAIKAECEARIAEAEAEIERRVAEEVERREQHRLEQAEIIRKGAVAREFEL